MPDILADALEYTLLCARAVSLLLIEVGRVLANV